MSDIPSVPTYNDPTEPFNAHDSLLIRNSLHQNDSVPESSFKQLCDQHCAAAVESGIPVHEQFVPIESLTGVYISGYPHCVSIISENACAIMPQTQLILESIKRELNATIVAMPKKADEICAQLGSGNYTRISSTTLVEGAADFATFWGRWQHKFPHCPPKLPVARQVWFHCKVAGTLVCNDCQGCPDIICPKAPPDK